MPNSKDSKSKQSTLFSESEGDNWFNRNKSHISQEKESTDINSIKRVLTPFQKNISSILEIGCGNGAKLSSLCNHFNATGKGIDPSSAAVKHGNSHFPNINLTVSTASQLPYADSEFDFVYFGFCLYLVDRSDILKAISEADRVLKSGGFLAILDFDPNKRHKRPYHHKEGVFSFKTSHSDFFTAGGHYYLISKDSFSHTGEIFTPDSDERISISILYKEPDAY